MIDTFTGASGGAISIIGEDVYAATIYLAIEALEHQQPHRTWLNVQDLMHFNRQLNPNEPTWMYNNIIRNRQFRAATIFPLATNAPSHLVRLMKLSDGLDHDEYLGSESSVRERLKLLQRHDIIDGGNLRTVKFSDSIVKVQMAEGGPTMLPLLPQYLVNNANGNVLMIESQYRYKCLLYFDDPRYFVSFALAFGGNFPGGTITGAI